jgi:Immunity protein 70
MGLYLCVLVEDDEAEGVEIGSYADFNFFREAVTAVVENGAAGSICPVLVNHSDCDGEWSTQEAEKLLGELEKIRICFLQLPPVEFNSSWKTDVAKLIGLVPKNLGACFFDIDGEPLLTRLGDLARCSIEKNSPILFQ